MRNADGSRESWASTRPSTTRPATWGGRFAMPAPGA
jgi:hypothetical protein